jgi:hypothetical protein
MGYSGGVGKAVKLEEEDETNAYEEEGVAAGVQGEYGEDEEVEGESDVAGVEVM